MKKGIIQPILLIVIGLFSVGILVVNTVAGQNLGAPVSNVFRNLIPETDSTYEIGTTSKEWLRIYTDGITLGTTTSGCLETSSGGVVWSTGTACGTGGGGSGGGFTFGTGFIYNSTTTDQVLIGGTATTTTAKLEVNGDFASEGTGTSTISGGLEVGRQIGAPYFNATSTATSTFQGGIQALRLHTTASSTIAGIQLTNILSCSGTLETDASGGIICGTDEAGGGGDDPFTHSTFDGQSVSATTTGLRLTGSPLSLIASTTLTDRATTTNATTTNLSVSGVFDVDGLTSALTLTGATGIFAEYTGTSCTNQFVRSLDALGAATCATVGTGDVSGLDISDDTNLAATWPVILTGDTLSFGGLSTSTAAVIGNIPYFSGVNTFANIATSSVTINAPLTTSGTIGSLVGGTALTIDIDDIKAADLDLTDITLADFTNDADYVKWALASSSPWRVTYASSTAASAITGLFVGDTATTSIFGTATSTFGAGIQTTRLNATTASSTINGLILPTGGLQISTLVSCGEALETDGSGNVICGTDATGGGGDFAWTPQTYDGQNVNATTTGIRLLGSPLSLIASSTLAVNATTTNATTTNQNVSGSLFIGGTTGIRASASAGVLTLAGVGNTNNENLTLNFESTANEVLLDTGTDAILVTNRSIRFQDAVSMAFGNSADGRIRWDIAETNDSLKIATDVGSSAQSGNIVIVEEDDIGTDFGVPIVANPTLRIQSSDATATSDFLSLYHNQTDAIIAWGNGNLHIGNNTATTTFTSTGNVGIGTTSPFTKLSVNGQTAANYFTAVSLTATSSIDLGGLSIGTTTPHNTSLFTVGTSAPIFVIDRSSGRVGFGGVNAGPARFAFGAGTNINVNPNINLLVQDASDARMGVAVSDDFIGLKAPTSGFAYGGIFAFDYAGGVSLPINLQEFGGAGGKVAIASSTPWGLFSIHAPHQTHPYFTIGSSTATNLVVSGQGYLGLSTTSPFRKLSVVGDAIIEGTAAATSTVYIQSSGATQGGRIILEDVDGAGCTEVTALNGVLAAQTVTCP